MEKEIAQDTFLKEAKGQIVKIDKGFIERVSMKDLNSRATKFQKEKFLWTNLREENSVFSIFYKRISQRLIQVI